MRLAFTQTAERDLEAIGDRIALDNPTRAVTFIRELRKDCTLLTSMPQRHPLLSGYGASGIRRRVCGSYLIFYRVQDDTVQILHILHGAMDYEANSFPKAEPGSATLRSRLDRAKALPHGPRRLPAGANA